MCHLVLLLPFRGLVVFWVLPLSTALSIYLTIFAVSAWLYWYVIKSMRWPVQTGVEKMLRSKGTIAAVDGPRLTVSMGGEFWSARSSEPLQVDDEVEVTDVQNLVLTVRGTGNTNDIR